MDYSKRKNDWEGKFFKHLDDKHPDLVTHFYGKIFFSPNMDNPAILHAAYTPLDDTEEFKDIAERMFIVFEEFLISNPV